MTEPTTCTGARDERGIALSAPLSYRILLGAVQCLRLANGPAGTAEALRARLWPFMERAGDSDPQQVRVPCDMLRQAILYLRVWSKASKHTLWAQKDDAELTEAWRCGLLALGMEPG